MIVSLGEMDALVEPLTQSLVGGIEADVRSVMVDLGETFARESPRLTGAAADSIIGWIGTQPGGTWSPKGRGKRRTRRATTRVSHAAVQHEGNDHRTRLSSGHSAGGATGGNFAAAFADWHLPQLLGVTMTVPYSWKLSQGESQQKAKGWVLLVVADVIAQHQEAA